jgi:hypothetical protein
MVEGTTTALSDDLNSRMKNYISSLSLYKHNTLLTRCNWDKGHTRQYSDCVAVERDRGAVQTQAELGRISLTPGLSYPQRVIL